MTELKLQRLMQKVAEKSGVSVETVKEKIQAAIKAAYTNPTTAALLIPRKDTTPTINEVAEYLNKIILHELWLAHNDRK